MYCNFCGVALQVGVARCPSCGSPIPYRVQEPGQAVQNAPLSLPQSGEKQADNGHAAPPSLPSKLSDYKPTGSPIGKLPPTPPGGNMTNYNSASMPGIAPGSKLSHYSQAPAPPSPPNKLSDYKQPFAQRSKLSDYKTSANSNTQPTGSPDYNAFSSMPTAGLGSLNQTPPIPAPGTLSSPSMTPIMPNPSGRQPAYPRATNGMVTMSSISNSANSPSFVPPTELYTPNLALPVGGPPPTITMGKQKKRGGLLMGVMAFILLIVCIASFFFLQRTNSDNHVDVATKIATTTIKPLSTVAPIHGPSGNISVSAISVLFSEPQMTAGIDGNDKPTQVTNTFTSGQTIYVTFSLNSKDQKGYVKARWYKGKQLFREVEFAHDPNKTNGYFSVVYDAPTTDSSVELYWSTTASFSDAKLARVAHFTVTR